MLCNLYFDFVCYVNYRDKMAILCELAAADGEDGLDRAASLIKGAKKDKEAKAQAGQLLEQYGYGNSFLNGYYIYFLKQCIVFAAGSVVFFAVCLTGAYVYRKRRAQAYKEYLRMLRLKMMELRNKGAFAEPAGHYRGGCFPGCEAEEEDVFCQLEMLREELDTMREQAYMEKERTKGIVTDLSHQLKTPVAALDTCFTVLERQALCEEERAEFYARCRQELDGLEALLDALVQISHMEAGMIQVVQQRALLLDTLLAAVNRIYPKAAARQVELVFDYKPEVERLEVLQDAKWLCEAFMNLLDNAVKYSPAGSEVRIGIQKQASFVRIEIADQGIGIPKKEQHKVFQRFYRGSEKRVQEESGSGVGLYLVRRIIEEHHGNVSVRYGRGKKEGYPGSIFVVHIPK
ncbi:MAG: HAMP domain-containing histidine kinase [Eubacterium sp.]|nr:HAMP domain-containing histidine kinase [Eubacterium sp.]